MRRCFGFLMLPVLLIVCFPAWAADPPAHRVRVTWEQHFATANVAKDGHLTQEEAKAGYKLIGKHFEDIDVDHKGYVTLNDVRAWRVMRKAAHRLAHPAQEGGGLRPVHAMELAPVRHTAVSATAGQIVTMPSGPSGPTGIIGN